VGNEASDEVATETFELMVRERHPAGVPIINLVPSWTRIGEERSYRQLTPSLRYGEHTKAILGELGYSAVEIERLFELKVSHSHFPAMGPKDYFFNAQKKSIDVL